MDLPFIMAHSSDHDFLLFRYLPLLVFSNPSSFFDFKECVKIYRQLMYNPHLEPTSNEILLQFVVSLMENDISTDELQSLLRMIIPRKPENKERKDIPKLSRKKVDVFQWKLLYLIVFILLNLSKQTQAAGSMMMTINQILDQVPTMESLEQLVVMMGEFLKKGPLSIHLSLILDAILRNFPSLDAIPNNVLMILLALNDEFRALLSGNDTD